MFKLSLNHYYRIGASGLSYIVFGIGVLLPSIYVLGLAVFPLDPMLKQAKTRRVIQCLCLFYVGMMRFIKLIDYSVEFEEKRSIRGQLVIANHPTLIDALFSLAYVDNLCCVVKQSLFTNPFTRMTVRFAGYIPNGSDELISLAINKLNAGENILIFPEGTRNAYDTQLDFKRGAANIAVAANCDILPIVIDCYPRTLQKHEKWYQLPTQKSNFLIRIKKSLAIEKCVDRNLPRTLQYRRLTEYIKQFYLDALSTKT